MAAVCFMGKTKQDLYEVKVCSRRPQSPKISDFKFWTNDIEFNLGIRWFWCQNFF